MHYATYSGFQRLTECFNDAVVKQQNIVLRAGDLQRPALDFGASVASGLNQSPPMLEYRFLYDARGSELYEQITEQPEYYPTRTEAGILHENAAEISALTGPCTLIELGSGSSVKTGYLLSAYQSRYDNICYTPIDISADALNDASRLITLQRPKVHVIGIHGTYTDSFPVIRCTSPSLIIFLGSTIGNFTPGEEHIFWSDISKNMKAGDHFLLGVDLVKDTDILEAAYNDKNGVTEKFTKNYFTRMNRELGTSVDIEKIGHVAYFNPKREQVEIYIEFQSDQTITLPDLQHSFSFAKGERIMLEISRKFRLNRVLETLSSYGLQPLRTYTDEQEWFGLLLLEKKGSIDEWQ
jgi:L-histidine N-alpha-methyltransferase